MISVFISYSRLDKAIADYIGTDLRNRGADVFLDYHKLVAGENFIGRLGHEIQNSNFLVLLLSPHSVASKWVQAEVAWALHCGKEIIPVELEAASMVDFFFLVNREKIDFKGWSAGVNIETALRKLARALNLPRTPINDTPVPPIIAGAPRQEAHDPSPPPTFATSALADFFSTAAEIADDDPEGAIFLYRQVLDIDPNYAKGRAKEFVERHKKAIKPKRLRVMKTKAEMLMRQGEWSQAERIARDIVALEPKDKDAQDILALCAKNVLCEPLYQQAFIAAEKGRRKAVLTLMRDIHHNCPTFGDPKRLIGQIRSDCADLLRELAILAKHDDDVRSVGFSPDGTLLASGGSDNTVRLWSIKDQHELMTLTGHRDKVRSVAFSPDGLRLVSAGDDCTVRLWSITDGYERPIIQEHSGAVISVAFSPDGSLLASGGDDPIVQLGIIKDGRRLGLLDGHQTVFSVAFSPDGMLLASADYDGGVRLWSVKDRRRVALLDGHKSSVTSIAFSPDGSLLASGSADCTVQIWSVKERERIATLDFHGGTVTSVTFSPDGTLLASGSVDYTARLWSVKDRCDVVALNHPKAVTSLAFSPDGALLASGLTDGTVRLWGF